MKLRYCLSVKSQNQTKHYRILQNKPVLRIIYVNTFTEILTHSSSASSAAGFSQTILLTAWKERIWLHFALVATVDTRASKLHKNVVPNTKETSARYLEESFLVTWQSLGLALVSNTEAVIVQDHSGKCLPEERQILNQWTEYCSELYNHRVKGDPSVPNCPHTHTEDDYPIPHKEERDVSWSQEHPTRSCPSRWRGCSHHNIQQDLADRKMANSVDPVLSHHTSQEKQPAAVPELPNDQPHQSHKQSQAEDHAEQIEATSREDHHRTGRLQIREELYKADFNLRILCEKYLKHQQDFYHVFIDFKIFHKVWHAALWATMKKYNHIQVIKNLYNKATDAVLFNSSIGDWF